MSNFSRRAMAYAIAIMVAVVAATGVNYWQGTPPTTDELRWLLRLVEVSGGVAALGLVIDIATWLWRRARKNSN